MDKDVPIVCIVGPSGCGKTTLMEGLIKELSKRGYRVATIKHSHHAVEFDQPGKDSWRHRKAGATLSIISSSRTVAVFGEVERELTVKDLCHKFIRGVDLVLAEGYKESQYPKIAIVSDEKENAAGWEEVKAVFADQPVGVNVPFRLADVVGIATFIEEEFLSR